MDIVPNYGTENILFKIDFFLISIKINQTYFEESINASFSIFYH